jgi:hypothetical protein
MSQFENSEVWLNFADIMLKKAAPPSGVGRAVMNEAEHLAAMGNPKSTLSVPAGTAASGTKAGVVEEALIGVGTFMAADAAMRAIIAGGSKLLGAGTAAAASTTAVEATALTVGAGTQLSLPLAGGAAGGAAAGGAAAGGAAATGAGLGLAATVGLWAAAIGAVVGVGGYLIWDAAKADDDVNAVIDRAGDLDAEGTDAEGTVAGWITELNQLKNSFGIKSASGEKIEKAVNTGIQTVEFKKGIDVLKRIRDEEWPNVKPVLKDWWPSTDPAEFEEALDRALKNYGVRYSKMEKKSFQMAADIQKSISGGGPLLDEISQLDAQISSLWAKPDYSAEERQAIEFGKKMKAGKVHQQEVAKYLEALMVLREDLKNKILPQAQKWNKTRIGKSAVVEHPISKRAVELPKQPDVGVAKGPVSPVKKPVQKSDTVATMQRQVNDLAVALNLPLGARLKEDGVYGQLTARAVSDLIGKLVMEADPEAAPEQAGVYNALKRWGVTGNEIMNIELMRKSPRLLNRLTNEIDEIYQIHVGMKERPLSQRQQQQQQQQQQQVSPGQCNWNKANPSREESLACFQTLYTSIGGSRTNLYDYAHQNLGMSDNDIFNMLHAQFPGWAPRNWSVPIILDSMGQKYSVLR